MLICLHPVIMMFMHGAKNSKCCCSFSFSPSVSVSTQYSGDVFVIELGTKLFRLSPHSGYLGV